MHRRAPARTAALARALLVVGDGMGVEHGPPLVDGLEPGPPALDTDVLVEQSPVEAFDDAVGPGALHPGRAALDGFELTDQLVGMAVGAASELEAVDAGSTFPLSRCTAVVGGFATSSRAQARRLVAQAQGEPARLLSADRALLPQSDLGMLLD